MKLIWRLTAQNTEKEPQIQFYASRIEYGQKSVSPIES